MTSSFPLFNLPLEAILHVLKSMDYGEFISISLLSNRAKRAVKLMNLKYRYSFAVISNHISLVMNFDGTRVELRFTMDKKRENQANDSLALPDKMELRISTSRPLKKWIGKGGCIKRWITHFNAVFHFSKLYCLQFDENASRFDFEELKTLFCSYDELRVYCKNQSYVKSILKHFPTRRLSFENDIFNLLQDPYPVLIQNYDELVIEPLLYSPNRMELDDLLIINSKTIEINNIDWTGKQLNRFLKHWIKGSNPRMEKLSIEFFFTLEVSNKSDILKGIKCMEMPAEHTRWFKSSHGVIETVTGGYDFYRCDGTKATLTFRSLGICSKLEMYVWYPHCVVEVKEMEN
ncbi:hypothetical protein GCK72_008493 [Caenorhabditis remanei]|uniref:F-box domain-containing protein n=1 Tax=Caenorhabditis remanei TaxID=31234 RepID=A0A6A5GYU4_CAERE|nr:hypothetical protein GCK72_008493 [Caenorhabditis remanei]KAF1760247.1 hypothetical protein GCK72_008493 [Caenorhabditis remanei]